MKLLPPFLPRARGLGSVFALAAFAVAVPAVSLRAAEPRTISDLGLELMLIPAGTFTMGSPASESGRTDDEGPQTRVRISQAFWLGQTEVTQGQWKALMGTDVVEQARRMLADDTLYDLGGKKQTLRDYYKRTKESDPNGLVQNAADDAPMYWVNWEGPSRFAGG